MRMLPGSLASTTRNWWGLADAMGPDQPWVYPYVEDLTVGAKERAARMGRVPLRPVVPIELIGVTGRQRTFGLVDSGSEHTLIAPWLARATGTQPRPEDPELEIGIGGGHRIIRISRLSLALIPPPGTDDTPQIWEAEVGILDHWEAAVVSLDRRIRRWGLTTSPTVCA